MDGDPVSPPEAGPFPPSALSWAAIFKSIVVAAFLVAAAIVSQAFAGSFHPSEIRDGGVVFVIFLVLLMFVRRRLRRQSIAFDGWTVTRRRGRGTAKSFDMRQIRTVRQQRSAAGDIYVVSFEGLDADPATAALLDQLR